MGFKRLFEDKKNLINFLNIIFRGRKDIFDLMVETSTGEEIVIEMQTTNHSNLKKRMLYYASRVISDKAPTRDRRGRGKPCPKYIRLYPWTDFTFDKSEEESETDLAKVFYMLKNMSRLDMLPRILDSEVWSSLLSRSRTSNRY